MKKLASGWIAGRHEFQYFCISSHALLVEWPVARDRATLNKVNSLIDQIEKLKLENVIEFVPGYHSLMIYYQSRIIKASELIKVIEDLELSDAATTCESETIIVKVSYNTDVGQDLEFVAHALDFTIDELIDIHAGMTYDVHFIGFLPGFLYLGGLDQRLTIPRRETPRVRVPAGSVALAAGQTGIYPIESPGGWHIIGRTEFELFNPISDPPCPIRSGMQLKFEPL